jgi:hypothetical protein
VEILYAWMGTKYEAMGSSVEVHLGQCPCIWRHTGLRSFRFARYAHTDDVLCIPKKNLAQHRLKVGIVSLIIDVNKSSTWAWYVMTCRGYKVRA